MWAQPWGPLKPTGKQEALWACQARCLYFLVSVGWQFGLQSTCPYFQLAPSRDCQVCSGVWGRFTESPQQACGAPSQTGSSSPAEPWFSSALPFPPPAVHHGAVYTLPPLLLLSNSPSMSFPFVQRLEQKDLAQSKQGGISQRHPSCTAARPEQHWASRESQLQPVPSRYPLTFSQRRYSGAGEDVEPGSPFLQVLGT